MLEDKNTGTKQVNKNKKKTDEEIEPAPAKSPNAIR